MTYDAFRTTYNAWLTMTPTVHTLSATDPRRFHYQNLGHAIHAIDRETLENYLQAYYVELHDEEVA